MARKYTRAQRRQYKAARMKQAALVSDRLMDKPKFPLNPASHQDVIDAMSYKLGYGLTVPNPRKGVLQ